MSSLNKYKIKIAFDWKSYAIAYMERFLPPWGMYAYNNDKANTQKFLKSDDIWQKPDLIMF